jgi:hypothetical protein
VLEQCFDLGTSLRGWLLPGEDAQAGVDRLRTLLLEWTDGFNRTSSAA